MTIHRTAIPLSILVALLSFFAPTSRAHAQVAQSTYVEAQPGALVPTTTTTTTSRPNLGLIIPGAVLLGVGWVFNFIVGLPAGDDPFDGSPADPAWDTFRGFSLVPAIGPWVQLAIKPNGFNSDYWGVWLVLNGVLQTTGLVLLIVGIATPSEEVTTTGPYVQILPSVSPDHAGLMAVGAF